jgi:hypothetical protein
MPASVAKYVFSSFWKRVRFELASGVAVAKVVSAKLSGVRDDWEKSIEEKDMPPDETSGTPEMVVLELSQVMTLWMELTASWTSAGRVVEPITKQAVARRSRVGAENVSLVLRLAAIDLPARAAVKRAKLVKRVTECIVVVAVEQNVDVEIDYKRDQLRRNYVQKAKVTRNQRMIVVRKARMNNWKRTRMRLYKPLMSWHEMKSGGLNPWSSFPIPRAHLSEDETFWGTRSTQSHHFNCFLHSDKIRRGSSSTLYSVPTLRHWGLRHGKYHQPQMGDNQVLGMV